MACSSRRQDDVPALPPELADEALAAGKGKVGEVGIEWAVQQVEELLEHGAPSVHFYVMQSAKAVKKVLAKLDL